MITKLPALAALLLTALLTGCSAPAAQQVSEPGVRLAATLVSPTDIQLDWAGDEPGAAGRVVEFATEPQGQYTVLQFVSLKQTRYRHPDLIPETPFYYRVRPFYGPASPSVEITLPPGEYSEKDQAKDHEWAPPRTIADRSASKQSIRAVANAAAAPTNLKATVMHANGIKFTWTDHASDEEGYLLEVKTEGSADFTEAAVLDPEINSVGLITLPGEKKASYRVRAFYYGKQSNVAHQTTGRPPSDN